MVWGPSESATWRPPNRRSSMRFVVWRMPVRWPSPAAVARRKGYAGTPESPIPPELEIALPEYGETLRPDLAVREMEPRDGETAWQLLVRVLPPRQEFDRVVTGKGQLEASPHGRMKRLLRRTGVRAGLLFALRF